MAVRVQRYRGCLALPVGQDQALLQEVQALLRDCKLEMGNDWITPSGEWHVTVATKEELQSLEQSAIEEAMEMEAQGLVVLGMGGYPHKGMYFVACVWPKAQAFRVRHGLPRHDLHITLSNHNEHHVDKSFAALIDQGACLDRLSMEGLEVLARTLLKEGKFEDAMRVSVILCTRFGIETTTGWTRLGDAAASMYQFKLAMLSYAQALRNVSVADSKLATYCVNKLWTCSDHTEWGLVCMESEQDQVPQQLQSSLLKPWPLHVWQQVQMSSRVSQLSLPSREHLYALLCRDAVVSRPTLSVYKLPRFFRWIVPFHLAAMSTPRNEQDIAQLVHSVGIRHLVTLTAEEPLPTEWFAVHPHIRYSFLPIGNYKAPSMEQIDLLMSYCNAQDEDTASPLPVLVHCGGGKGRAGTMLACYLVAFGFQAPPTPLSSWQQPAMGASEAIQAIRALRPGSIETEEQEAAIAAYCSHLWKRRSVLAEVTEEPPSSTPIIEGQRVEGTDLLVLCGLPGSGKSSFRNTLLKRCAASESNNTRQHNETWVVLSGDEDGRKACERSISQRSTQRAILDRCNGTIEDRTGFLALASTWCQHATAVSFDFPLALCASRAQQRAGHPSLRPGRRVLAAIGSHAKTFVRPSLNEGFKTIVRITSIEAGRQLASLLAPSLPLIKFPRTAHLFDTGAATTDDLVLRQAPRVTSSEVVITEKVDGANMGLSLDASGYNVVVQNRSHLVVSNSHAQFRQLDAFLEAHRSALRRVLLRDPLFPERYILYGEWLAATHSIHYTQLRSLFYAYDLFDRVNHCFMARETLSSMLQDDPKMPLVPVLYRGSVLPNDAELMKTAQHESALYEGKVEGIYIKWEAAGIVKERAKVVRGDFLAGNEHWTKGALQWNAVVDR